MHRFFEEQFSLLKAYVGSLEKIKKVKNERTSNSCSKCGSKIDENQKYCPECGKKL